MKTILISAYPGKPGPAPTGLRRRIAHLVKFEEDEWEYLCRIEERSRAIGHPIRKAQFIRHRIFKPGWRDELLALRKYQGANLP